MYSASLAQASSNGIMLSILMVAIGFGIYFISSRKPGVLGAVILMLLAGFLAKNYYYLVYGAGFLLGASILMYFTSYDEGTVRESLFYAGAGIFLSLILYYLMPEVFDAGKDQLFIIMMLIAAFFILIPELKGNFSHDWLPAAIFLGAAVFAWFFVNTVGVTHLIWGAALMFVGVLWGLFVGIGTFSTITFVSGFLIWLDDVVGYTTYNQNQEALAILTPVGIGLIAVYLYLLWRD
ncbi:hypothetical protein [Pyrococcus kukulkanii]|uniref:DUF4203 domain-containing protein n=1 Tax=Pyrococcus kukulkanii TaxID=1609559 RepID=A0ABV4T6E4_9EURY